jgi:hypothetical protein
MVWRLGRERREREDTTALREWFFHLTNLGSVALTNLLFYVPAGYLRVMAPHLLLSLLVMVRFRRYLLVGAIVVSSLVTLGSFLDVYRGWALNYVPREGVTERSESLLRYVRYEPDYDRLANQREQMARLVRYRANAPNPWCNTLLLPVSLYDERVTLIPAGIGVSYILDAATRKAYNWFGPALERPVKSRYVLLARDDRSFDHEVDAERLRLVGTYPFGRLYENPVSRCSGA